MTTASSDDRPGLDTRREGLNPGLERRVPSLEARAPRLRSLDLYRGVAVLLMILAHACDALLDERWKQGDLWHALNIAFGFVAPAFLFLSGAGIGLSLARRSARADLETNRAVVPAAPSATPFTSRLPLPERLALTLALAYWLQIPVLSLRQLVWNQRPEQLARLFDSNILHVVAITGLVLVGLSRLGLTRHAPAAIAGVLAAIAIVAAPHVWSSDAIATLWLPLRAFAGPQPPATFPLLPHAAYALLGFVAAPLLASSGRRTLWLITAIGVILCAGAPALDTVLAPSPPHDDFWRGSILHSLFRLGGVLLGLGVAMLAARRLPPRTTLLERIGQRSLAVYVLHLMLLYGSPMTMGARYWFGGSLDRALGPLAVGIATVVVAAVTCAAALLWPRLRERAPGLARMLFAAWWALFALLFALTP